jgi:putative FmdB family regulatory protein
MPIYEYECPKCGRFDALQKMSEPALKTHDVCGSKVTKLMSASAFAFKGSGFYITDYNGRNSAAITGRSDPKADAKPEPKPDAKDPKKDAKAKPAACAGCPSNKSAA